MKISYTLYLLMVYCLWHNLSYATDGRITHKTTGQGVPGGEIYIENTTIYTEADSAGYFSLHHFPPPPYRIAVSCPGFATVHLDIDSLPDFLHIEVSVASRDLEEYIVKAPLSDGWARFGDLFMKELIGYSPFAAKCRLTNKEALQFYFDEQTYVLTVRSSQPLRIENNATGYIITYWMNDFTLHMLQRLLFHSGHYYFKELAGKSSRKKRLWAANRSAAFHGSLNHFMRTLYTGTTYDEGFRIQALRRIDPDAQGMHIPVSLDTISITDRNALFAQILRVYKDTSDLMSIIQVIGKIKEWHEDTSAYNSLKFRSNITETSDSVREVVISKVPASDSLLTFRFFCYARVLLDMYPDREEGTVLNPPVKNPFHITGAPAPSPKPLEILYEEPVHPDSLIITGSSPTKKLRFDHYLYVTYLLEKEEKAYTNALFQKDKRQEQGNHQVSIIGFIQGENEVNLEANGNFSDPYSLITERYWSYEKLDKILPLDYVPD